METKVFYCRGNLKMIYLCAGKKPAHNFYISDSKKPGKGCAGGLSDGAISGIHKAAEPE